LERRLFCVVCLSFAQLNLLLCEEQRVFFRNRLSEAWHLLGLLPQAAARMERFPPADMVTTLVTFNRCLYAQLAQQVFEPPRGFPMPPPASPAFASAELGMKLTVAMEMMVANRARFGIGSEAASTLDAPAGPRVRNAEDSFGLFS
jgi:SGT1 protein